mmetsp:Transcript_38965/g.123957  ORF Transcript_38965/g.123957 Transcript_38965/m.123957 type:complete len:791 (-) Transcript_38965:657-3029(-)
MCNVLPATTMVCLPPTVCPLHCWMDTALYNRCPICNASLSKLGMRVVLAEHPDFPGTEVVECSCNGWFGHPLPNISMLRMFYETKYNIVDRKTIAQQGGIVALDNDLGSETTIHGRRARDQSETVSNHLQGKKFEAGIPHAYDVLEVGCGWGMTLSGILGKFPAGSVRFTCHEYDKTLLGILQTRTFADSIASGHGIVTGDEFRGEGYADASFDAVLTSHVLEHMWRPLEFLTHLLRVVRKDGFIFTEIPLEIKIAQYKGIRQGNGHLVFLHNRHAIAMHETAGFFVHDAYFFNFAGIGCRKGAPCSAFSPERPFCRINCGHMKQNTARIIAKKFEGNTTITATQMENGPWLGPKTVKKGKKKVGKKKRKTMDVNDASDTRHWSPSNASDLQGVQKGFHAIPAVAESFERNHGEMLTVAVYDYVNNPITATAFRAIRDFFSKFPRRFKVLKGSKGVQADVAIVWGAAPYYKKKRDKRYSDILGAWKHALQHGGRVLTIEQGFLGNRDYYMGWDERDVPCGQGAGALLPYSYGYHVVNQWRMDGKRLEQHNISVPRAIVPSTDKDAYILLMGQVPWDTQVQPGVGPLPAVDECRKMAMCSSLKSGERLSGYLYANFLGKVIEGIRRYSKRPIVFRPHPSIPQRLGPEKLSSWWPAEQEMESLSVDTSARTLEDAIQGAHVVVGFNSNSLLLSILRGRPIVALSNCSLVSSLSSLHAGNPNWADIEDIPTPAAAQVEKVARNIAYLQWSAGDIESGAAWDFLYARIARRGHRDRSTLNASEGIPAHARSRSR